ncbi:sugar phosphate nucleotidyltransferase [Chloroflexota bacterium]
MFNAKIKRAVILAAGDSDRMGELTKDCPKVLLPINREEPLVLFPIRALAAAGIRNIAIVVGYLANEVRHNLGDGSQYGVNLHYVENPDYLGGDAISAWKAKSWTVGEPVILCMGDHIIKTDVIRRLLSTKVMIDTLCVDYRPMPYHNIEEATKVALFEDGSIRNIGKELRRWDALDTGVFLLTESFFNMVEELAQLRGNNIEISDVISLMVARGHHFNTCDVSSCSWMDIDIEEDLKLARSQGAVNDLRL